MSRIWLINHYASTLTTGWGSRIYYLARELARMGHEVTLVAARCHHLLREGVDTDALPAEEMIDGFRFVRIDVPRYGHANDKRRILAWFAFAWKLPGLRRRPGETPDTILYSSPDLVGYLGAERLARACGARLVFEVRDIWPLTLVEIGGYSPRHPFIRFLQWVEDRAYARADRVVSNLEGAVEHMAARGMDRNKFTWVANGISLDEVESPAPLDEVTVAALPKNKFVVGYTGTVGTANALNMVISAAYLLRTEEDIHFLIVGEGRDKHNLQQRTKSMNSSNITFINRIPKNQIQSMLKKFDVCVLSTIDTSLYRFGVSPNKIFDYLYSGKPVITAYSGKYDIVKRHNAGLQVPAGDPEAFARAVKKLRDVGTRERSTMGKNGKDAILCQYTYSVLAKRLEEICFDKTNINL